MTTILKHKIKKILIHAIITANQRRQTFTESEHNKFTSAMINYIAKDSK